MSSYQYLFSTVRFEVIGSNDNPLSLIQIGSKLSMSDGPQAVPILVSIAGRGELYRMSSLQISQPDRIGTIRYNDIDSSVVHQEHEIGPDGASPIQEGLMPRVPVQWVRPYSAGSDDLSRTAHPLTSLHKTRSLTMPDLKLFLKNCEGATTAGGTEEDKIKANVHTILQGVNSRAETSEADMEHWSHLLPGTRRSMKGPIERSELLERYWEAQAQNANTMTGRYFRAMANTPAAREALMELPPPGSGTGRESWKSHTVKILSEMSEAESATLRKVLSDGSVEEGKLSDYLGRARVRLNDQVLTALCNNTHEIALWPTGTIPPEILSAEEQEAFTDAIRTQIEDTLHATLRWTVSATGEEKIVDYVKGWCLEDETGQGSVRWLTGIRPVHAEGGEIEYEASLTTIA